MKIVTINGITYTGKKSVQIINNLVIIDGLDVTPNAKEINIQITGDVALLNVDACKTLTVTGSAGEVTTQSGDVHCGEVHKNVTTMSGNVYCRSIRGRVSTMSGNVSA